MLILSMLLFPALPARGHETRPAYLEIKEITAGQYRLLWKRPVVDELALRLEVQLPQNCRDLEAATRYITPGSLIERRLISCGESGLAGQSVGIEGLEASITDALVRVQTLDAPVQTRLLKPASPFFTMQGSRSGAGWSLEYVVLGIDHILRGMDHLLFVLGLLLIVGNRWMLFKTITSFTVAHSVSLGAATLGYATVPVPPLNALIALSILFLGPEIVRSWRGQTSLTIRRPWLVAFAFGLLHGFGFAGGLTDLGLPRAEIPLTLLLFNLGVELGQIGFVLLVFALDKSFRLLEITWPRCAEFVPGYAVGSLGAFWTIERAAMMLGVIK
jgi:hydrogenase/urease accessory protein HupE